METPVKQKIGLLCEAQREAREVSGEPEDYSTSTSDAT